MGSGVAFAHNLVPMYASRKAARQPREYTSASRPARPPRPVRSSSLTSSQRRWSRHRRAPVSCLPLPAALRAVAARGTQPVRRSAADRRPPASASTRRQYGAIFRVFGDWLAGELGRPPVVGDLDADVIAAYGRHLAASGGRGGGPAAPATVRVYLSMVRAFARDLGLDEAVAGARVPRYEPGPPETLTDTRLRQPAAGSRSSHCGGQARLRAAARVRRLRAALGRAARPAGPRSAPPARQRPPPPPLNLRQGRPRAGGAGARGRPARPRDVAQSSPARPRRRPPRRAAAVRAAWTPRR